jgi:hypothetical protein
MLHVANKGLVLMARLLGGVDHGRRHHEDPAKNNLNVLMLCAGDLRE